MRMITQALALLSSARVFEYAESFERILQKAKGFAVSSYL